jgi:phosphoserine phosphatase
MADDCWAFGDDVSDVPMLSAVGHPVAVIGDHALDSVARSREWRRLHLATPGDLSLVQADLSALVGEAI